MGARLPQQQKQENGNESQADIPGVTSVKNEMTVEKAATKQFHGGLPAGAQPHAPVALARHGDAIGKHRGEVSWNTQAAKTSRKP
jgi:hypothetical protein